MKQRTGGFAAVEIVIGLLVIGLTGYVGYMAVSNASQAKTAAVVTTTPGPVSVSAPQIESSADLTVAQTTLDSTSLDANTSQLDADLASF